MNIKMIHFGFAVDCPSLSSSLANTHCCLESFAHVGKINCIHIL